MEDLNQERERERERESLIMEHVCFPRNMQESNQIERRQRNQGEKNKSFYLVVEKKIMKRTRKENLEKDNIECLWKKNLI